MAKMVHVHAAKTHLSRLIDAAAGGEEIVIARAGKPIAQLGPLRDAPPIRKPGLLRGKITMADDFDAPLPREWLDAFYNGPIAPRRRPR